MSRTPNTNLPEGWIKTTINQICSLYSENYEPNESGKKIYIGLEHIDSGNPNFTRFGIESDVKSSKHRFYTNDILYGKLRPYLDKAVLADSDGISSSDILIIRTNKKKILSELLINYLHSERFLHYTTSTMSGTTLPRTNWKSLRKYTLFIPPRPEQQKIVAILENVDNLIQTTQKLINKLQNLKRGLMQRLFTEGIGHTEFKETKLGRIPKAWKELRIKDLANIRRGASPRPISDTSYFSKSGRGWVRISDVTGSYKYLTKTKQYLSKKGALKSVPVNPGDLIMSICATIGKPIILDMKACIHDGFVLFQKIKSDINTDYFFYYLKSNEYKFKNKKQIGTQGNLNTSIVKNTRIALPTNEEQKIIVKILSNCDNQIFNENNYYKDLKLIKKGLMQVLLTGKKRVKV